jgi:hypothetical protein
MIGKKITLLGSLAVSVLLFGTQAARATFSIANVSADSATGEYQYSVSFVPSSAGTVNPGQGFVIYDFPNLVTSGPDDWSLTGITGFGTSNLNLSQQLTGNAISSSLDVLFSIDGHTDNPSIENLSFAYNGGSGFSEPGAGATGTLTLWTTDLNAGLNTTGGSGAQDTEVGNQNVINNITTPYVPEPTTLAIMGLTSAALLGRRARKTIA